MTFFIIIGIRDYTQSSIRMCLELFLLLAGLLGLSYVFFGGRDRAFLTPLPFLAMFYLILFSSFFGRLIKVLGT